MTSNKKPYARTSKTFDNKDGFNKDKNKKKKNKNKNKNKNINNESTPKVRLDKERIEDIETLDTSFLEGRISTKKTTAVKEKLLIETKHRDFGWIKYVFGVLIILIVLIGMCFIFNGVIKYLEDTDYDSDHQEVVVPSPSIDVDIDNNYLFLGTFNTNRLDFEEDYHYIKISEDHYNTNDFLNDMTKKIYQYNPTYVFIELGINELYVESNEDFITRLGKIIDGIKENRPKAKIYVESIYPINREVVDFDNTIIEEYIDNEMIYEVNKDIKKMVESKAVNYLDLYSLLVEDDNLIEEYTDNGIYLNDKGYMVVYDEIDKIIGRCS